MLEGKAKRRFKAWYPEAMMSKVIKFIDVVTYGDFLKLDLAYQWGVILEFADSEGYIVTLYENDGGGKWGIYMTQLNNNQSVSYGYKANSRKEAQQEAIKKLNELLND